MVQNPSGASDLQKAGAQIVHADFDSADTLDVALAGVDRALLLSPVDQRLVERETRFVERARKAGLKHLVKFSAIGAHAMATNATVRASLSTASPFLSYGVIQSHQPSSIQGGHAYAVRA
jgi:uncharacterized protein YbjT (DUF2867 family)